MKSSLSSSKIFQTFSRFEPKVQQFLMAEMYHNIKTDTSSKSHNFSINGENSTQKPDLALSAPDLLISGVGISEKSKDLMLGTRNAKWLCSVARKVKNFLYVRKVAVIFVKILWFQKNIAYFSIKIDKKGVKIRASLFSQSVKFTKWFQNGSNLTPVHHKIELL